jgi:hypothetical protein
MTRSFAVAVFVGAIVAGWSATAQGVEPKIKVLAAPEDPTQGTVLIGRASVGGMVVILELERAKSMWMRLGNPPQWTEHRVRSDERFHVEVKPVDPISKTRISYVKVSFDAVNKTNGQKVALVLHPMWGESGLHYGLNNALAGDGSYVANITVDVPGFGRAEKDKELWSKPVTARFHFKLADGKLTEVSEPAP